MVDEELEGVEEEDSLSENDADDEDLNEVIKESSFKLQSHE
jgi:hypothetical protein